MGAKQRWHGMKRGTKWSYFVYGILKIRFPRIKNGGVYNRRLIADSKSWSQHSWGNALDVTVPSLKYGDGVKRWMVKHKGRLNIEHLLWRVPDHYTHLHADWSPNYQGTPPK